MNVIIKKKNIKFNMFQQKEKDKNVQFSFGSFHFTTFKVAYMSCEIVF